MGLASLQKQLLEDILKTKIDIVDYHRGKKLIEQRLCKENILLVLDDVDNQEQIDALAAELNWFGQGSRVIITSRDEHILNMAKVNKDKIYWPQVLDHKESLQLFSLHAFSMDQPPKDYVQFSHDAACYSGGLPLTLEVLGSYLSDIRSKKVWKSTLQKLKEIPHEKVQRRLKLSYDNLEDDYQKAIFLDAACFFIGWEKETVITLWEACGYHPESAIHRLIKRSFLKFEGSYLRMHDQIRDMGRDIVLEENLMEPGKRSRLWSHGQILEVLEGHKGTDMIKGIILPSDLSRVSLDSKHFEMMSNLRFLDISSANFMGNLAQRFQNLKVLDLSECRYLSKSPDFSWFPYLEQLDLGNCDSLDKLDESIGQLSQLKNLILKNCWQIKELPMSIGDLKFLVELQLSASGIKKLPDHVGLLEKLEVLDAKDCHELVKLPRSMGRMRCLRIINLRGTGVAAFPDDFSILSNLVELKISPRPTTSHISTRVMQLSQSKDFFNIPRELAYLPELPSSLVELHCEECSCLGTLLPNRLPRTRYSFTTDDRIYNRESILCIVLELFSETTLYLHISASIYQKGKTTRCFHTLRIEDVEVSADRDIIYIHHFKGFDWFGIPLQGKDGIEILDISTHGAIVKYWEILFKNKEHSSAMMVAEFFNWSYVNDNNGVHFHIQSLTSCLRPEVEGSNSVSIESEEEEGELKRASDCKGAFVDGSNQHALDQPSHVQEKGIPLEIPENKKRRGITNSRFLESSKIQHCFGCMGGKGRDVEAQQESSSF
ncbi:disease resistance protein RUN1-like [Telopea speciosissima]|uniref:disease resistance protein RUN1-like n=1 Tax=Telopea speciosissima TaxID=54955 RepID=UPI001CC7EF21|nr:disease resistance protein RUN1-like [Telopea speciosissima]